jgi:glycosyltransferase involved in cell wall biosynthesis
MDKSLKPIISIILSAYNGQEYISEAIKSTLNQSFANFELIIINDGSTDNTDLIINEFTDKRIKYYNIQNIGLSRALNFGISKSNGEFIARIDQDDLMLKNRLDFQLNYLIINPSVDLIGSSAIFKNGRDSFIKKMPSSDLAIKFFSMFENPFIHSSVMIKRSILDTYSYNDSNIYSPPEDYDLWSRMINNGLITHNTKKALIIYNNIEGSLSKTKNSVIKRNSYKISKSNINKLFKNNRNYKCSPISLLYFKIRRISFPCLNVNYFNICIKFVKLKGINFELLYYILFFYLKLLRNNYIEKEENFNFRW